MSAVVHKLVKVLPLIGVVALFGAAFWLSNRPPADTCGGANAHGAEHLVVFTDGKVTPQCLYLTAGESVTWLNRTDKTVELGADPHPVHSGNREVSGGGFVLTIRPGESIDVMLKQRGNFGYHDHNNPSAQGMVVVK